MNRNPSFLAANHGEHVYCWVVGRSFEWTEVSETRFAPPANDAARGGHGSDGAARGRRRTRPALTLR